MLLFPLSYFPADIPLIVFNRPSKTTQVRILNFDLINLRIFLVGSCHSAVLPLHDVLLVSVLKCPCICIDLYWFVFLFFLPKVRPITGTISLYRYVIFAGSSVQYSPFDVSFLHQLKKELANV